MSTVTGDYHLRESEVREETIADILWHNRPSMTAYYSVAQVIDTQRGIHDEYVFTYSGHRIETMNNSGWQRARKLAGLGDLHVHDLRHTVGMRLREAEVREETIADILWHNRPSMTAHYSVAQVTELIEALNKVSNESNRGNRSLVMIARDARNLKVPQKSPDEKKADRQICA